MWYGLVIDVLECPDSTSFRIPMISPSENLLFVMMSPLLDPEDSLLQWLSFRGLDQLE
jgi:hypothetical protein